MNNENNKLKFTVVWSSAFLVLLLMVGLGVNSSLKGTAAASNTVKGCPPGTRLSTSLNVSGCCKEGYSIPSGDHRACCPNGYSYYSNGNFFGFGEKGCYKAPSSGYGWTGVADNTCISNDNSHVVPNCYTSAYTSVEDEIVCTSGAIDENGTCVVGSCSGTLNEDGVCVEDSNPMCCEKPNNGGFYSSTSCSSTSDVEIGRMPESECLNLNKTGVLGYCCKDEDSGVYTFSKISCGASLTQVFDKITEEDCLAKNKKKNYTISYDSNGGSGYMATTKCEEGSNCALSANQFTKSCYSFTGWNTEKDGTGISFKDKNIIVKINTDMDLYAQWGNYSCGNTNPVPSKPTSNPTSNPISKPTSSPTSNPTSSPTSNPTSSPTSNPTSSPTSNPTSSPTSNPTNVEDNPGTGEIAIFMVWIIAGAAIVYSIWYFKQLREN